jgi:hypothetical protein
MSKHDMFRRVNAMPYSYSEYGPKEIGGVGNYVLHVEAPRETTTHHMKTRLDDTNEQVDTTLFGETTTTSVLRLYFLDSQGGTFTPAQRQFVSDIAAREAHKHVPALMFFHIPIYEFKAFFAMQKAQKTMAHGHAREAVSHGDNNSGFFDTMTKSMIIVRRYNYPYPYPRYPVQPYLSFQYVKMKAIYMYVCHTRDHRLYP